MIRIIISIRSFDMFYCSYKEKSLQRVHLVYKGIAE